MSKFHASRSSRPFALVPGLVCLSLLALGGLSPAARGEITTASSVEVRILLDNSGSMYPGYQPTGVPHPNLAESGGRFYVQYPEFSAWINDFVKAQSVLGAEKVSFYSFTSGPSFVSGDVRRIQAPTPLNSFNFGPLVPSLPPQGSHTYIAESLRAATAGFEGIVWLITDNIVEKSRGVPDQEVARFFQELADTQRFRAVHLYKLPFERVVAGKPGNLAIYGLLISPQAVGTHHLRSFDNKFRGEFLEARRASNGGPLFPHKPYWKLKDLSIGLLELELRPKLKVEIIQQEHRLFRERQIVKVHLVGNVASRLTQHKIISGAFEIRPEGEFRPEGSSGQDYGLQPIPADAFDPFRGRLPEIPPRREAPISADLVSNRAIPLETEGFGAWLKSASKGLTVTFRGQAVAYFTELEAEFDRSQMEGIFGAEAAPEIFRIPPRLDVRSDISNPEPIFFELKSGYGRMLLFTLLLLLALAVAFLLYWFFGRPSQYRMRLGDQESFIRLRRLGSHAIVAEGHAIGTLKRGLLDDGHFVPNRASAAITVAAAPAAGTYDITFRDRPSLQLQLERIGGGPVPLQEESPSAPPGPAGSGRIRIPGAKGSRASGGSSAPPPPPSAGGSKATGASSPAPKPPTTRPTIRRPDQR